VTAANLPESLTGAKQSGAGDVVRFPAPEDIHRDTRKGDRAVSLAATSIAKWSAPRIEERCGDPRHAS
jgi:hypothetical protein